MSFESDREALSEILDERLQSLTDTVGIHYLLADAVLAAGFRRSERSQEDRQEAARALRDIGAEVPEPSAEDRIEQAVAYIRASWVGLTEPTPNTPAGAIIAILEGERSFREPQGEPSDAAKMAEAWGAYYRAGMGQVESRAFKAGWRAASGVGADRD